MGVRARKVDELEHAHRLAWRQQDSLSDWRAATEHDGLPGLDLPNELSAHGIERAGLRGDDGAAIWQASEAQRPDPKRVADANQGVLGEKQQAVGALESREGAAQDRHDVG